MILKHKILLTSNGSPTWTVFELDELPKNEMKDLFTLLLSYRKYRKEMVGLLREFMKELQFEALEIEIQ